MNLKLSLNRYNRDIQQNCFSSKNRLTALLFLQYGQNFSFLRFFGSLSVGGVNHHEAMGTDFSFKNACSELVAGNNLSADIH